MPPFFSGRNDIAISCRDESGTNMRPSGGVFGALAALDGAIEHQAQGTPHLHAEYHVVTAYQYDTMKDIAEKLQVKKSTVKP